MPTNESFGDLTDWAMRYLQIPEEIVIEQERLTGGEG